MVRKTSGKGWMPVMLTNVQDGAKNQIIADPLVLGKALNLYEVQK